MKTDILYVHLRRNPTPEEIRAVNCHDELVNTVKQLRDFIENARAWEETAPIEAQAELRGDFCAELLRTTEDALAKAQNRRASRHRRPNPRPRKSEQGKLIHCQLHPN